MKKILITVFVFGVLFFVASSESVKATNCAGITQGSCWVGGGVGTAPDGTTCNDNHFTNCPSGSWCTGPAGDTRMVYSCTNVSTPPTNSCPAECRQGTACGTGYSPATGCSGSGVSGGCTTAQVCCKNNTPPSCGNDTSTPPPCVTSCTRVVDECRNISTCYGTGSSIGANCGVNIKTGEQKVLCTYNSCSTVCSTPPPTPTPPPLVAPILASLVYNATCNSVNTIPVTFNWSTVPGAASYFLRIDDTSNGFVQCGTGTPNNGDFCLQGLTSTSHTINLALGKTYNFWLNAYTSTNVPGLTSSTMSVSLPMPTPCPTIPTATPTPTPTPITAMCVSTTIYTPAWAPVTSTAFQSLPAGGKVYFCVNGSTTGGTFDKARFTINGVMRPEVTLTGPNAIGFCDLYTIPTNTYAFAVQGEVFHSTLGWQ